MAVSEELKKIIKQAPYQREELATHIGVSASTIDRWASGTAQPNEKHLRNLRRALRSFDDQQELERIPRALGEALPAVRELMHKHGAASSRNDAIDQVSIILMIQIHNLDQSGPSLSKMNQQELQRLLEEWLLEFSGRSTGAVAQSVARTITHLLERQNYLMELIGTLGNPLEAIAQNKNRKRGVDFTEIFVSFLSSAFHEEKEFAQYMTPVEVVTFMVTLALHYLPEDLDDLTVLDPSCGTGSFLNEFAKAFQQRQHEQKKRNQSEWIASVAPNSLHGIDTSERMVRLASASLVASGIEPSNIYLDNALEPESKIVRSKLSESNFDLILTNPPFGAEHSKGSHSGSGTIPSELAFLIKYVEWLKPGGILLTIVPDSVLTNKGAFSSSRAALATKVELLAVVSLPSVAFAASGTTTKTSVLICRKNECTQNSNETFFAVADQIGFQVSNRGSVRKRVASGENQLPKIASQISDEADSATVIRKFIGQSSERWDAQYWISKTSFDNSLPPTGRVEELDQLASLVRDRKDPRRLEAQTFKYIEISGVDGRLTEVTASEVATNSAPSRARLIVRENDVLISTVRPERRTVGVVPAHLDGAICSTGFAVLRPKDISPFALARALRSNFVTEQLVGISSGVAYPAFDADNVHSIKVPLGDQQWLEDCERYGEILSELEEQLRKIEQSSV